MKPLLEVELVFAFFIQEIGECSVRFSPALRSGLECFADFLVNINFSTKKDSKSEKHKVFVILRE